MNARRMKAIQHPIHGAGIKRSLLLAAWGLVSGLLSGLATVSILSIISMKNFFDSPIRIAVFITACALIGGISIFSASFALSLTRRLPSALLLALTIDLAICAIFKLLLLSAGNDSPIGKVFVLVTLILALFQVVSGSSDRRRPHQNSRQVSCASRGAVCAAAVSAALFMVWFEFPLFRIARIDGCGIAVYAILGFLLTALYQAGKQYVSRKRYPNRKADK